MKLKNKIRGFSLLELLLVLGVIAALVVISILTYNSVRDSNNANKLINEIGIIKSSISELYSSKGSYTGLNTTVLIKSGSIPLSMMKSGDENYLYSETGIKLQLMYLGPTKYQIYLTSVSTKDCSLIINAFYKTNPSFQLGNNGYGDANAYNLSQLVTLCQKASDSGRVSPFILIQNN